MFQFSTKAIGRQAGLEAWREIFGRTVCSLDIDPIEPDAFVSDATICRLPGLGLLFAASSAVDLRHSRELIVDDDLSFMAAPTCRYTARQLGRTAELEAGAGVLMNNAEVGSMTLAAASRFITFRVPRAPMAALVGDLDAAVARPIPADNPALKLLVGYLNNARDTQALTTPELQRAAVAHIYDLLALALGATRETTEIAYGRGVRAARLRAAKALIARHIGRHDLSAATIAAHLNITPRYVHMLFETEGSSVAKFVTERRLADALRMLSDPCWAERTISAIAFEAGFGDLSHFNRMFRRDAVAGASGNRDALTALGSDRCVVRPMALTRAHSLNGVGISRGAARGNSCQTSVFDGQGILRVERRVPERCLFMHVGRVRRKARGGLPYEKIRHRGRDRKLVAGLGHARACSGARNHGCFGCHSRARDAGVRQQARAARSFGLCAGSSGSGWHRAEERR
jgi:AraC-like DNA-binding protein